MIKVHRATDSREADDTRLARGKLPDGRDTSAPAGKVRRGIEARGEDVRVRPQGLRGKSRRSRRAAREQSRQEHETERQLDAEHARTRRFKPKASTSQSVLAFWPGASARSPRRSPATLVVGRRRAGRRRGRDRLRFSLAPPRRAVAAAPRTRWVGCPSVPKHTLSGSRP